MTGALSCELHWDAPKHENFDDAANSESMYAFQQPYKQELFNAVVNKTLTVRHNDVPTVYVHTS
jgi:hypothetical protein